MAGVQRLSRLPFLLARHARRARDVLFSRYLLVTNTTITVGLGCTGDLLQQNYERFRGRQAEWDRERTGQVLVTGFVIGPTCHFWYLLLDRFLPGRSLGVVLRKVLIDQVVFSPVNIGLFLLMVGYLSGDSGQAIRRDLYHKGKDLLKAEWLVWPPAQLINFLFLPTKYRVLYDNSVSLAFDSYYSYVTFSRDRHQALERAQQLESLLWQGEGASTDGRVTGEEDYVHQTADELESQMLMDRKASPTEMLRYTCRIARYHQHDH